MALLKSSNAFLLLPNRKYDSPLSEKFLSFFKFKIIAES